MRSFAGDRRGVTIQVGAILLFGIAIVALSTYQAVAVPAENEQVEFNHNQAVQQDMLELRSALLQTGAGSRGQSVSVSLGTTYPSRVLLINPPPPSGSLRTDAAEPVNLTNVEATNPETRDYLAGNYSVERRPLTYDPSYNVYDAAPSTSIEGSVVVNGGPSGEPVAISGQSLVSDKTVSLVVVRGNLSRARSGSVTVDPTSPDRTVETTVRNETNAPLNLTVTTSLSAERWRDLVADETAVRNVTATGSDDTVRIRLEPIPDGESPYTLRVAVVDVGSGAADPPPQYVTSPQAPNESLAPGDDVVFEVRDRYNNPADGSITVTDGAGFLVDDDDGTPDTYEPADREDGQYRLRYLGGDGTVNVSLPSATGVEERAKINVTEITAGGGGGGGGGGDALESDEVAFNDADGDGVYDRATETAYTEADFDPDGDGAEGDFEGEDIVVTRDVTTERFSAEAKSFTAQNVTIEATKSGKDLKITTGRGIDLRGSTLQSSTGGKVDLAASDETEGFDIDIRNTEIRSGQEATAATSSDGRLLFNDATGGDPGTRIIKPQNGKGQTLELTEGTKDGPVDGQPETGTIKKDT